jgi:photosystem II stability/assembly factor-like uncharacterized protein
MKVLFWIAALAFGIAVNAQVEIPDHIAAKLGNDKSFRKYSKLLTGYMDSLKTTARDSIQLKSIDRKYKKLARQLHYLEGRLDRDGNIVNASRLNYEAIQAVENARGNAIESEHLGTWELVGPDFITDNFGPRGIGRVDRIAFHPTDANTVYAGTPCGGLWKSTTGGTIWSNVNKYIPSLGISGIVISHADPNTIYVLTGDGDSNIGDFGFVQGMDYIRPSIGVLKSTDGGDSWSLTGLDIPGFYVGYKLIQSPYDANVLLAATSKGIYRTANGGSSWTRVSSDEDRYYDIEWRYGSTASLFACTGNRFFMSASAGQTWADLTNRIPDDISGCERMAIAITPDNEGVVYVLAGQPNGDYPRNRLFRSSNAGGTFFLRSDQNVGGGSPRYMWNIAVSPVNYDHVVVGNLSLRFSENGGTSFVRSSSGDDAQSNYVHADIHELIYNPHNNLLFIGSDGGAYTSSNHGTSMAQKFLGMAATQYYHFNVAYNNNDFMINGAQDNGIMIKDDNTSFFSNYMSGDGFDIAMPHNGSSGKSHVVTINTNTYFLDPSLDGSYYRINQQNAVWYKPVAISWFDSTKFVGGQSIVRWRGFGSSNSFAEFSANGIWALTTSPSNSNKVYAAGGPAWNDSGDQNDRSLTRSDDAGATWTQLIDNQGLPDSIGKITSIALHPLNSNTVYITLGGFQDGAKIFQSANGGVTWNNRSENLPNVPVNAVVVAANGDVFIGTDIGVYCQLNGTLEWVAFFNGLPKVPVTDLEIRGSLIFASTFGRGIWKSGLHGNCPRAVNITGNQSGRIFYEGGTITSDATLVNGFGTEIYAKAVDEVTLQPGFRANGATGVEFRSWIGNCGVNGIPANIPLGQSLEKISLKVENNTVSFDLPFGVLASFYATNTAGEVQKELLQPERLQPGKQVLNIPSNANFQKLALVVDGEVWAVKEL